MSIDKEKTKIKQLVKKTYAQVASNSCCLPANSCCSPETNTVSLLEAGKRLGYSEEELTGILKQAGFADIVIDDKANSDEIIKSWNFGAGVEKMVFSAYVKARKPLP